MALVWNPVGIFGLLTGIVLWILAAIIFAARPDRVQNRMLALMLAVSGFARASGFGLIYLTDDPATAFAWQWVNVHAFLWTMFATLAFIGTIPTPIARPFAGTTVRLLLLVGAVATSVFLTIVGGERVVAGVQPSTWAPWDGVAGPWLIPVRLASWVAPLLSLGVAIAAITTSKAGSAERKRAKAYSWAFGVRDVGLIAILLVYVLVPLTGTAFFAFLASFSVIDLTFAILLTLGILRTQLFDIDLKLKWTLKRGTVVGAFAAVFFIAAQIAQEFLADELGWAMGGLAAGALLLAIAPIQRVADRMANAAMPTVGSTVEYASFRKFEVYKAAVEEMLRDGELTAKDRKVLEAMRVRLGLPHAATEALERDLMALPATS